MSDRSGSPSDEGEGDVIRPYGDDHDSSEESEDDPEEAKRIAEGFIVDADDDEDDDDDDDEDAEGRRGAAAAETEEERRRRRRREKKERRRARREQKHREREADLSEDELELLNENRGLAGPSRPVKRPRRQSGSPGGGSPSGDGALQDMFRDDEDRLDDDEDDLGDFIEDDEEEESRPAGETEEERRQRRREEKLKRREQARLRPDLAGVDRGSWDEIFAVFGDGNDYDWALVGEEGMDEDQDETQKKDIRLEDVFDPSEIKERRLQDEDKAIAQIDRPERHQLVNSTLSDNPVFTPDALYPPPDLAAGWAYNRISDRTKYLFCGMSSELWYNGVPNSALDVRGEPLPRRVDLAREYVAAVSMALNMMFVQHLEVPFLWHYKRDVFSVLENEGKSSVQFLELDDLWALYVLGIRFRAIYERIEQIRGTWEKIKARRPEATDEYLVSTLLPNVCLISVETAAEGMEWLGYHYTEDIRLIKEDEAIAEGAKRLPPRMSADEPRFGAIMKLVQAFGVSVPHVAMTFMTVPGQERQVPERPPTNPEKMPLDLAEEYAGPNTPYINAERALQAAASILVGEFARDPTLRQQAREFVEQSGLISVKPTERGMSAIDEYHTYYNFKFLSRKPFAAFHDSPQFLHILKAEEEGLVKVSIEILNTMESPVLKMFEEPLANVCQTTDDYGDVAKAWNEQRAQVVHRAVADHLIPAGYKWAKDHLRSQAEEYIADACRRELEFRVNVRPYATGKMDIGQTPSVLAITNGKGEIKDAVIAMMLDDEGNIRTSSKFDNLRDEGEKAAFKELLARRKPDVVVVGGMSIQAAKLRDDADACLRDIATQTLGENPPLSENYMQHDDYKMAMMDFDDKLKPHKTPIIFASDATARMYMFSEQAEADHPTLPVNARYAWALARYVQNPLNAYCRLGRRITEVSFIEHHQKLISQEKLLVHLERGLVNCVCVMGIEVNSCVGDPYQRAMLPFIAGLGPRKADALINGVTKLGALTNRMQLSDAGLFGPTIFENVAGFLSIEQDLKEMMLEENNPHEQPDPLDCTRIHPEDYDFARKMCQDALDLDQEDVEGQHRSEVVLRLMQDDERAKKLYELNLDDFAFNLQRQGEGNKRESLRAIVAELVNYRADGRPPFQVPSAWEVVTMLTGETERTIGRGVKVTVNVRKPLANRAFCALDCGMDAVLEREMAFDSEYQMKPLDEALHPRQTLRAVVIRATPERFQVEISLRQSEMQNARDFVAPFQLDPYNDEARRAAAEETAKHRQIRRAGKVKRQVDHPNWHVMNSGQAEQFLASQQRGDVVIRPSSKGPDHIAVTWKVDEDVYQHIDVQEIDKPNEYSLGRTLRIGNMASYSDLDELITYHIKTMARKVDEIVMHDKYKPEEELESYLKNYVQAHPGRSMYGFCIDTDRPGYIRLQFLNKSTKDGGVIQTWPVKILPGGYQLGKAEVPGVNELCNAFKLQYSAKLQDQAPGGKTPGPGYRTGRTPMGGRTPGGRTPALGGSTPYGAGMGRTPMRPGMTPNPYGGAPQPGYGGYGGATPSHAYGNGGGPPPGGGPPQPGYGRPPQQGMPGGYGGGMTPSGLAPAGGMRPPMGMNPERAAMLARPSGGGPQ